MTSRRTRIAWTPNHLARYRDFAGDGIFRVSVGLEDAEDLCGDLDQAMATESEQ